jgi:hypothetical protein
LVSLVCEEAGTDADMLRFTAVVSVDAGEVEEE